MFLKRSSAEGPHSTFLPSRAAYERNAVIARRGDDRAPSFFTGRPSGFARLPAPLPN